MRALRFPLTATDLLELMKDRRQEIVNRLDEHEALEDELDLIDHILQAAKDLH